MCNSVKIETHGYVCNIPVHMNTKIFLYKYRYIYKFKIKIYVYIHICSCLFVMYNPLLFYL